MYIVSHVMGSLFSDIYVEINAMAFYFVIDTRGQFERALRKREFCGFAVIG